MGNLINILKSVLVENISEEEDFDHSKFGDQDVTPKHVNKDLVLERHLRLIFKQMKKVKNLEEYHKFIYSRGIDLYSNDPQVKAMAATRDIVARIPKFIGAKETVGRQVVTTLIYTFIQNGGYSRDFSKGVIDLTPLVTYDVEAETVRDMTEYATSWGEVYASSPEEAMRKFQENPDTWASDSEHNDTDYGDFTDVDEVNIHGTNELRLNLNNLGFDGETQDKS